MYSTMKTSNGAVADKYRTIDVRSDTVSKPTKEMMQAMMEVKSSKCALNILLFNITDINSRLLSVTMFTKRT